jgi:hypothetical protein
VHEDAIVQYAATQDLRVRTTLYKEFIQPVFHEMVDKIVYTYKFNNLPNVDCLKEECKVWLVTILDKFDPSKGYKAFSYFSVITKNWFIQKTKKNKSKLIREIEFENIHTLQEKLVVVNEYHNLREKQEFFLLLSVEVQKWKTMNLRTNELKVVEAIQILFEEKDNIEIFNKKAIYLYLREITGMNTKQIVNNLNKIRQRYRIFKEKWDEGEF